MSKELPYFKFETGAWENGNVQMCSREDKGLFIDLCSMYWARLGEVPLKLAIQKLCGGNATALDSLIREHIISVEDDQICIDFLNEQLDEFENISETNSQNALEGWKKRRKNATAMRPQSDGNAIREEERREEKIRGEEKLPNFEESFKDAFDEITCDRYKMVYKETDLGRELQLFRIKCDNDKPTYYSRDAAGLRTAFQYQLKTARKNGTDKKQQHTASIINALKDEHSKLFGTGQ